MKISRNGSSLTHLFFADDSLIFCKVEPTQPEEVMRLLNMYEKGSGQLINMEKYSVFFSKNVEQEEQSEICNRLRNIKVAKQGKYLGLSMVIIGTKDQIFGFTTGKCQKTISSWSNIMLSQARKEGEESGKRKIHWCSWKRMTTDKNTGGLDFKELQGFNKALLGK
ncbi:uncharacterized protein [Coffea arabica]|uniref:Reverse transcriptase domain-containing protein n=1 Tax=Coffea arabica TaxID=13443 RepID=A0ABM4U0X7_COFAR